MKFVHCADIHLDSPFAAAGLGEGERLRNSLKSAFSSLIMEAKLYGAKMLFIAGDLFEEDYVTKDSMLFLSREFERFGEKVFITPGNHDPYGSSSPYKLVKFPENVTLFKSKQLSFEDVQTPEGIIRVYGHAYDCESPSYFPLDSLKELDDSYENPSALSSQNISARILVSHAVVDEPLSPYACLTAEQLRMSAFDYVALGHIHKPGTIEKVGKSVICYSGCLEGRDFGECGTKGAIFGEITKDESTGETKVNYRFKRICERKYEAVTVDVSSAANLANFGKIIQKSCSEFSEDVNLRIRLVGAMRSELALHADVSALSRFVKRAKLCEVLNETSPFFDAPALEKDSGVKGEFFRCLKPKLLSEDPEERRIAALALSYGLSAFNTSTRKDRKNNINAE